MAGHTQIHFNKKEQRTLTLLTIALTDWLPLARGLLYTATMEMHALMKMVPITNGYETNKGDL